MLFDHSRHTPKCIPSILLFLLSWMGILTASDGMTAPASPLDIIIEKKGGLPAYPIAAPDFVDLATGKVSKRSQRVTQVIIKDLESSGFFRILNKKSYIQKSHELLKQRPDFRAWRLIGADMLVAGSIQVNGKNIVANLYLYDVAQGRLVGLGKQFYAPMANWRFVAHRVADEIYTRVTGEQGYFSSRIAFIAEKGRRKWLAVMDSDGANAVHLTRGRALVLTPRFSPSGSHLFYLSYTSGFPRIYRWNLYTGQYKRQGNYRGLNSAPSWSPDGERMALTLSKDGNPEIYIRHLKTQQLVRLTRSPAIDTSPSWSPDGRHIVFNSDRGGSPQLYIMDSSGNNVRRITFKGAYNAAPTWSPRGDLIAFVKGQSKKFRIAVINPEGKRERILTDSWMDESPTWSPNGRVILFSRQSRDKTRLYTIDLTGHNERQVPLAAGIGGSDPSWSPLIR
ncbi:Tol-Pal system beta propeller repeat protein TolB [Magnetococcales bacterium HHB-1]